LDLKASLQKYLQQGAKQLKEGDSDGLVHITRGLYGSFSFSDDENIWMIYNIVGSISADWLGGQAKKEKGLDFIKTIGAIMEKLAEAYGLGDSSKIDLVLRELVVTVGRRWKESPLLASKSEPITG